MMYNSLTWRSTGFVILLSMLVLDLVIAPLLFALPAVFYYHIIPQPYNYAIAVLLMWLPAAYIVVYSFTGSSDDEWPFGLGERLFMRFGVIVKEQNND